MIDFARHLTRASSLLRMIGSATLFLLLPSIPALAAPTVITEFFNTTLGHYVLITSSAEVAFIEAGGAGPGWQKTGKTLNANTAADDAPSLVPVCRFYGSISPGPNSHFFTADPDECASVKTDPGWHFEGIAFYVAIPANGQCAAAQMPVWRAYNNGFKPQLGVNDGNHRFSVNRASIRTLIDAAGWSDEGVVFCAQADNPTVPFRLSASSASLLLLPGAARDVFVTVEPRNGFTGNASLTASGLPPGVSYQFSPATASVGSGPVEVALRLTVADSAPATPTPGIITINAVDGGGLGALAGVTLGIASAGDPVAIRLSAIAAVEERCRALDTQGLVPLAFVQSIAAFMAARPEYEAAGVDEETISAWGRFKDGTLHVVVNNLEAPDAPATAGIRPDVPMKSGAELPSATNARLLQPFGSAFVGQAPVNEMGFYLKAKNWTVRSGRDAESYIGALKTVAGDGFFYFNTHGTRIDINDPGEPSGKIYAIWSDTLVEPLFDVFFAADLAARRLVHMTARNFRVIRVPGVPIRNARDTRYGITYRFVDKYMSFTNESVIMMNACSSSSDVAFINAFLRKGAGVYLGWSKKLHFAPAFASGPYFVDRMLGANLHPDKESPPQRAFPYDLTLSDMGKKGLDVDRVSGAKLDATSKVTLKYPPIFAPSIRYARVNEYDEQLVLTGEFGEDKPKVTVGGAELPPKSWSATQIVANLPQAGPGSSGDVLVEVRNVKSNARQLSEWAIPLTYNWFQATGVAEWKLSGSTTIRYRADLAGYRLLPGETPKSTPLGGPPTKDSALTVTASGSHFDGNCTSAISGTGIYLSPASNTGGASPVLASFFKLDGKTRLGALGMAFGALASPHSLTISGGSGCAGTFPFAAFLGSLEGPAEVLRDQTENPGTVTLPAAQFTLDANFGIPSKREIDLGAGGEVNVFWPAVPAKTPPRDTDDAGK